jgi:predicted transcriptional regulator
MTITLSIKLDEATGNRLMSLSKTRQHSSHKLMREAIREYLDKADEMEIRNCEADAAWDEYKHSGKFISNDEVTAWLDTWGTEMESPCPTQLSQR